MIRQFKKDVVATAKLIAALYAGISVAWTSVYIVKGILELIF